MNVQGCGICSELINITDSKYTVFILKYALKVCLRAFVFLEGGYSEIKGYVLRPMFPTSVTYPTTQK